ncbi:MAG: hypothetical protein HRU11_04190 [Parvularculaceae bacterium]|nr:hypothetical protein [Parvularculaceae bacterium]
MRSLVMTLGTLTLAACSQQADETKAGTAAQADDVTVTIQATVPEGTGALFITGNVASLGPWSPDGQEMTSDGTLRTANVELPEGYAFEYKFTQGTWDTEAVQPNNIPFPNFQLTAEEGASAQHDITTFKASPEDMRADWQNSGVLGTLIYEEDVASEFLNLNRILQIWLPPGYDDAGNADKRYPVIYMTDGQNLHDPRIANTGVDWGMDEAMMAGVEQGLFEPAIIVATWSTAERFQDYSPWHNGPNYGRFLTEELKPRIDAEYRTLPERDNTFAMGSSMGGLMSMYLVINHSDVFSACGCLSTHVPLSEQMLARFTGQPEDEASDVTFIEQDIRNGKIFIPEGARMFFDYGTEGLDAMYGPQHAMLRAHFEETGKVEGGDYLMRIYPGTGHNETAWRNRAIDQLQWVLGRQTPPAPAE